jgi:hypothetical protein
VNNSTILVSSKGSFGHQYIGAGKVVSDKKSIAQQETQQVSKYSKDM